MKYSKRQIENYLQKIYSGEIDEYNLSSELYEALSAYLKSGLYKGFGISFNKLTDVINKGITSKFDTSDLDLLSELRDNTYMFSAAKTYQQTKEISDSIIDDNGTLKTFADFKTNANQIFDRYNDDWLKSEHTTAIGQAQAAVKWNSIEKQKDILPYLTYSTIGDACTICEPLNGMTAKVEDPIWSTMMPPNHFNCRCLVHQSEDAEISENKGELTAHAHDLMSPVFKMNSGKDKYIFNPDHPYFTVPKEDAEFAKRNFLLPIPKKD